MNEPQKYYNLFKAKRDIETYLGTDKNDEYFKFMPEFLKTQAPLKFRVDKDGDIKLITLGGVVPALDLLDLEEPMSFIVRSLTPFLKFPLENFLNYNSYLRKNIEDFKGQKGEFLGLTTRKRSTALSIPMTLDIIKQNGLKEGVRAVLGEDLLRNIRLLNFANSLYKIKNSDEKTTDKYLDTLMKVIIGKTYTYDIDRNYKFYVNTLKKLRSRIKFELKKSKNTDIIDDYKKRLDDIEAKLKDAELTYRRLKKEKGGIF
jgi:hypothetical protein